MTLKKVLISLLPLSSWFGPEPPLDPQYEFPSNLIPEAKPGGRPREVDMWEVWERHRSPSEVIIDSQSVKSAAWCISSRLRCGQKNQRSQAIYAVSSRLEFSGK